MRRILRKIASNDFSNLGDTSTLADPSVVDDLIEKEKIFNYLGCQCFKHLGSYILAAPTTVRSTFSLSKSFGSFQSTNITKSI